VATIWLSDQLTTTPGLLPSSTRPLPCDAPNPLPEIVTCVPGFPLLPEVGATFEILGPTIPEVTVKVCPLLLTPPTVTTTCPVVAPLGTVAISTVGLALVIVAFCPLKNVTVLLAIVDPKFEPSIVTDVPVGPLGGLSLVIVGTGAVTIKFVVDVPTPNGVTTEIGPVVAVVGTVAEIWVELATEKDLAALPLNCT
jgi:hypothetical protein